MRLGEMAQERGVLAYAVGGCVRDWWLEMPRVTDLDVAIEGDGLAFAKLAARELGAHVTSYEQFGTATLSLPSTVHSRYGKHAAEGETLRIDVATCRKERYPKPAAYPTVSPGTLRDDLFRRDFTINAMAMMMTPEAFGTLVDPFGGLNDLKTRRLRTLHAKSFLDDPSRILRAARFVSRYGLSLESKTARWLTQAVAAGALERLNRGRLRKEFTRMSEEPNPLACLACLSQWLEILPRKKTAQGKISYWVKPQ